MLFTWRKNKGILGKSQEVFTVFYKAELKQKCLCSGDVGILLHSSGGHGHVQAVCLGHFTLFSGAWTVYRFQKIFALQPLPSKSHCVRGQSSGPIRTMTRHSHHTDLETTQQITPLLGFITPIEDDWILWTFLHCAFPYTVTGSLINGDSLHSESLNSNDGLARFGLPFGFLLRKGFAKQFNHLKQECQSYSYGNRVKDLRNTHCLHANKAANYEISRPIHWSRPSRTSTWKYAISN